MWFLNAFTGEKSLKSEDTERTKKDAEKKARSFKEQKKQLEQQLALLSERNTELEHEFERSNCHHKQLHLRV